MSPSFHKTAWLALLLPVAMAVLASAPTLDGGFLSDDFLIGTLWDEQSNGVAWSRVFADFGRSWFGVDAPLYRPVLTLSFGVDLAVSGIDPFGYHLTNCALHVLATAATATIALVIGARFGVPAWSAILAGGFAALHPATIESIAWIAARNSGLEVALRNTALACFAITLISRIRIARIGLWVFAAAALAAKESAVVLLPCALVIDVLHTPSRPLRERLARVLPFVVLLAGYMLLRLALFGEFLGSPGDAASERGLVAIAGEKLSAVFWPTAHDGVRYGMGVGSAVVIYSIAAYGLWRERSAVFAAAAIALVPALMLPTHSLELSPALGGSRLILGAVHMAAIVTIAAIAAARGRACRVGIVAATLALGTSHLPSAARYAHYEAAWAASRSLLRDLELAGDRRRDAFPIALLGVNNTPPGTPPLNPNAWFPLAQRPFQRADHPLVSLGYTGIVRVPGSNELTGDPCAVRELWLHDVPILWWNDATQALQPLPERTAPELSMRNTSDTWRFAEPVAAFELEFVTGRVPPETPVATIRLLTDVEMDAESTRVPLLRAPDGRWSADLSHVPAAVLMQGAGVRVTGLVVEHATAPISASAVVAYPRVPFHDVARFDGAGATLDELATRLGPQPGMRVVLLAPQGALALPTDPDTGRIEIPTASRDLLTAVMRLNRTDLVWFFVETQPGSGASRARSRLDRFALR